MAELAGLVQRLEVAVGRLESISNIGGTGGTPVNAGAVSAYVEAFDALISGPVAEYISLSQKIGGDVQKHADMMKQAFTSQRQLLVTASCSQKPSDTTLTSLLAPVSKLIQQVQTFREQNRSSPFFNHLSAVSESVPALGWVAMVSAVGIYNNTSCISATDDIGDCAVYNETSFCPTVSGSSDDTGADDDSSQPQQEFSQASFDLSSFIGGIILVLALQSGAFFAMRFLKTKDSSYETIDQSQ